MTSKSHEHVFRPVLAAPHGPSTPRPRPLQFLWPQAGADGHTTRLGHQHGLAIVELEEVFGMDAPGNAFGRLIDKNGDLIG